MATVKIPPVLRPSTGGEKEVSADGTTVGQVLGSLADEHPDTKSQIFGDGGELNRYVNVYLNDEDVRVLQGLEIEFVPHPAIAPSMRSSGSAEGVPAGTPPLRSPRTRSALFRPSAPVRSPSY